MPCLSSMCLLKDDEYGQLYERLLQEVDVLQTGQSGKERDLTRPEAKHRIMYTEYSLR